MHAIKAELQKLFTTRTTYALLAIGSAITLFISFYVLGYRAEVNPRDPFFIAGSAVLILSQIVLLIGLGGALLVTNEYRYNTIMYTLTASRSRLKVFLAKLAVITIFSLLATLLFILLAGGGMYLGAKLGGHTIGAQNLPYFDLGWRVAFYGWAYSMLAMIFAFIIRNQIGTIVALIFLPGAVEGLLGLLLKDNTKFLPFTALMGTISPMPISLSPGKSVLVVLAYVVVGWIVAALLFVRRDAN